MNKTVLFNCTTNISGGTLQNAVNFIIETLKEKNIIFFYAVSKNIHNALDKKNIFLPKDKYFIFEERPSLNLLSRKRLKKLQHDLKPDLVYTMAGPAYVKFTCKHIMGITDPYLLDFNFKVWKNERTYLELVSKIIISKIKTHYAKNADYYVFQTNASKRKFLKNVKKLMPSQTFIVKNAINKKFYQAMSLIRKVSEVDKTIIKILCPAAYYPHKSLSIVPKVASLLRQKFQNFQFLLTLDESLPALKNILAEAKRLNVEENIVAMGSFDNEDSVKIHEEAHVIFLPSILEVFSTSYLESIASFRRFVVSDLDFSRDICGELASYFYPMDIDSAAMALSNVINDLELRDEEIVRRNQIISEYGDQAYRYKKIKDILLNV